MVNRVSSKDKRIVKARIKGKKLKEIAAKEYPNAKENSGMVLVSRQLKKPHVAQYYEQSKLQALKDLNITWRRVIKPISEGLDFESDDKAEAIKIRMSASKQARELLQLKDQQETTQQTQQNIPMDIDEIEVQRLLFKSNKSNK